MSATIEGMITNNDFYEGIQKELQKAETREQK
jgi:hypothetical protein